MGVTSSTNETYPSIKSGESYTSIRGYIIKNTTPLVTESGSSVAPDSIPWKIYYIDDEKPGELILTGQSSGRYSTNLTGEITFPEDINFTNVQLRGGGGGGSAAWSDVTTLGFRSGSGGGSGNKSEIHPIDVSDSKRKHFTFKIGRGGLGGTSGITFNIGDGTVTENTNGCSGGWTNFKHNGKAEIQAEKGGKGARNDPDEITHTRW
jgi:hypothetical protein